MYVIYKLRCSAENKQYIGITGFESGKETASNAILDRFKEHARENTPLGIAIDRHGPGDFTYEDLRTVHTENTARIEEHNFIRQYGTLVPLGYNQIP